MKEGKFLIVPIDQVQRFSGQPRKRFPAKELQELADSIATVGQIVPAIARPIADDRWELIDGERRWRACKLAGVRTINIVERDVSDESLQFELSIAANFNRPEHTPIEIAHAVDTLHKNGRSYDEIGKIFGKSDQWCSNCHRLLKLCPEVAAMLEPEDPDAPRISQTAAQRISELPPKLQIYVARKVIKNGYGVFETNRLIRQTAKERGVKLRVPKQRASKDWEVLCRFVHRVYEDAQPFLQMSEAEFLDLFANRTENQLLRFEEFPQRVAGEFQVLADALDRACRKTMRSRKIQTKSA